MRFRRVAFAAILLSALLSGCASSGGFDSHVIEGGPGQPIEVSISGVDNSVITPDADGSRQYTVQVEVGNSANYPVTVTQISIRTSGSGAFQVYPTSRKFNEMIDPLKDHLFELVLRGRRVRSFAPYEARTVTLSVVVTLANGDSYAYEFEGPVRDEGL